MAAKILGILTHKVVDGRVIPVPVYHKATPKRTRKPRKPATPKS